VKRIEFEPQERKKHKEHNEIESRQCPFGDKHRHRKIQASLESQTGLTTLKFSCPRPSFVNATFLLPKAADFGYRGASLEIMEADDDRQDPQG
jgi:hypothetical protein